MKASNWSNELVTGLNKKRVFELIDVIKREPEILPSLIGCLLHPYPINGKAAWILRHLSDQHPELVMPHSNYLLSIWHDYTYDGVKRDILKGQILLGLPENSHVQLLDISFHELKKAKVALAVKYYALEICKALMIIYPEIKSELLGILELPANQNHEQFGKHARQNLSKLK